MSFITRLPNFIVTTPNQEPSTEATQESQSQPQANLGIANSSDHFEIASTSNFDLIQRSAQNSIVSESITTPEMTVDASSIFNPFEVNQQFDNRLTQLSDKLNSLTDKRRELTANIENELNEGKTAQDASMSVANAVKSDKPIPDEILALLGSTGILGIIGGFPAIPILSGLLGFLGLTGKYKEKAMQAQAELDRKAEQHQKNADDFSTEAKGVQEEIRETLQLIEKEKLRLEREAQPAREQVHNLDMVQQPAWQEFSRDLNFIQEENFPFSTNLNSSLRKNLVNDEGE